MAKIEETILIESRFQNSFTIDSHSGNRIELMNRIGVLENRVGLSSIQFSSREMESTSAAQGELPRRGKKKFPAFIHEQNNQLGAGKIMRDQEELLITLNKLALPGWKLTAKSFSTKRQILNRGHEFHENKFDHFSLSVRLELNYGVPYMELGTGASSYGRLNRDGLKTRIIDLVHNNREARPVPNKHPIPVVLDSGDGGILFHEIIGHALEADYIHRKLSPFSIDDIGKPILSSGISIGTTDRNDPLFIGIQTDDEGCVLPHSDIIQQGVLNHILTDNYHSQLMNLPPSSSARTESFLKPIQPRMHGLYIKPGRMDPEEIIESVSYGVFAKEFGDGKVYFENSSFSFSVQEAYLIENGKITAPLGRLTLRGNIREVMESVQMIGNDFRYDKGVSYCFKNGQSLNVRVGQPTIKIEGITVSGSSYD